MFTSRCPSRMYASTGVIRGEPSFVSVPTRTNWNRSISSRPCDAISGAACSNSSQVSTAEAKQMSPAGGGGSFVVGGAPEQAAAEAKEPRDPSGRGAFFVLGGGSRDGQSRSGGRERAGRDRDRRGRGGDRPRRRHRRRSDRAR